MSRIRDWWRRRCYLAALRSCERVIRQCEEGAEEARLERDRLRAEMEGR